MLSYTNLYEAEPHLILLHGAGLGKWIWERVAPNLIVPHKVLDLPGRSDNSDLSKIRLDTCIDYVSNEAPPNSIIVGHSFSAEVALGVAATSTKPVAGIILVGGTVPESGKSFMSNLPPMLRLFLGAYIRFSKKGVSLPESLIQAEYCNDLDQATTDMVLANITKEVPGLYLDNLDWSSMPEATPRYYVKLLEDQSISPQQQDVFAERIQANGVETLSTGHLPMLAQPAQLAKLLNHLCFKIQDSLVHSMA